MSSQPHDRTLTPSQLVSKYPMVELFCWTPTVVGSLYKYGVLEARGYDPTKIFERSFLELIEFANAVAARQQVKVNANLYQVWTPQEVIEEHPELKEVLFWDASALGLFLTARLLNGSKGKDQSAHILLPSVWYLVQYVNALTARKQLRLNK